MTTRVVRELTKRESGLLLVLRTRAVIDKRPQGNGNSRDDGGYPCAIFPLVDEIEAARKGCHHDDEGEDLP